MSGLSFSADKPEGFTLPLVLGTAHSESGKKAE
jgi:hypothetical protein